MVTDYAAENDKVHSIREKLLAELDTDKIFVSWKDKDAKAVIMIIEGHTIDRERFNSIVGDHLPHDIFSYEQFPSSVAHAETRVVFHV